MECDVCGRSQTPKLPFHCPTCARSALYTLRIEHAELLLDKESMGRKVQAVVKNGSSVARENVSLAGAIVDTTECGTTCEVEQMRSETIALEERISLIAQRADTLRKEMEEHRRKISEKKSEIKQRSSDWESATYGLGERSAKELETAQSAIRRRLRRWDLTHQDIVTGRVSLCKAAAGLACLKRGKRIESGRKIEFFTIGADIPIFDLRDLNGRNMHTQTSNLFHSVAYMHKAPTRTSFHPR
jgi:Vacuolar sorting 38 and autophagy-related subunit 14